MPLKNLSRRVEEVGVRLRKSEMSKNKLASLPDRAEPPCVLQCPLYRLYFDSISRAQILRRLHRGDRPCLSTRPMTLTLTLTLTTTSTTMTHPQRPTEIARDLIVKGAFNNYLANCGGRKSAVQKPLRPPVAAVKVPQKIKKSSAACGGRKNAPAAFEFYAV